MRFLSIAAREERTSAGSGRALICAGGAPPSRTQTRCGLESGVLAPSGAGTQTSGMPAGRAADPGSLQGRSPSGGVQQAGPCPKAVDRGQAMERRVLVERVVAPIVLAVAEVGGDSLPRVILVQDSDAVPTRVG